MKSLISPHLADVHGADAALDHMRRSRTLTATHVASGRPHPVQACHQAAQTHPQESMSLREKARLLT